MNSERRSRQGYNPSRFKADYVFAIGQLVTYIGSIANTWVL